MSSFAPLLRRPQPRDSSASLTVPEALRSPAEPLTPETRAAMETMLGRDFSRVRVHTEPAASQSALALGAEAYAVGHHIVLGPRAPALTTRQGQALLGHELTHVAQQENASPRAHDELAISSASEPAELEAAAVAATVSSTSGPLMAPPIRHHLATACISRQRTPSAAGTAGSQTARPRPQDVVLEFAPDEKGKDKEGNPVGVIHVKVKGKEVATFDAQGGPSAKTPDLDFPGHFFGPTAPGSSVLEAGTPALTTAWGGFSQIADGTPLREITMKGGKVDVQFQRHGRWISTESLAVPLTRADIVSGEEDLRGKGKGVIPPSWDLNDFGKIAFHLKGTDEFIHTTPETELAHQASAPEVLTGSHGCIHIRPSDRDTMISAGFLQQGVTVKVQPYHTAPGKATPP